MQKVKVHRYVSGKRPDYAQNDRSDSESEEDDFLDKRSQQHHHRPQTPDAIQSDEEINDPRLRRLKIREDDTEVRPERRRHIVEPELLQSSDDENKEEVYLPGKHAFIKMNLINSHYNGAFSRAKTHTRSSR